MHLFTQWQQSNQTMKVFCAEKGITRSSLSYWMRQFGSDGKRVDQEKSFIALELEGLEPLKMINFKQLRFIHQHKGS